MYWLGHHSLQSVRSKLWRSNLHLSTLTLDDTLSQVYKLILLKIVTREQLSPDNFFLSLLILLHNSINTKEVLHKDPAIEQSRSRTAFILIRISRSGWKSMNSFLFAQKNCYRKTAIHEYFATGFRGQSCNSYECRNFWEIETDELITNTSL